MSRADRQPVAPSERERFGSAFVQLVTSVLALGLPLVAGIVAAQFFRPTVHSKYFLWTTGRALGIAAYIALTALVSLGLWTHHPWRYRSRLPHGETLLRAHAALGTATVALLIGHIASLVADRYAGVGWLAVVVPGTAHYRPGAIALGTAAFELMVLVAVTARLAGRAGGKHWLLVHRTASTTFALSWLHGVFAGADTSRLRPVYVMTGSVVGVLVAGRAVARLRRGQLGPERPRSFDHQRAVP